MRASISLRRYDTPLSAHQTPVWPGIVCDKLTRSVRPLWSQLAKTASPHCSDDERRPLEAGDVGNIVQRFSIMRRRNGLLGLSIIAKTPVSHGVEPQDFERGQAPRISYSASTNLAAPTAKRFRRVPGMFGSLEVKVLYPT
jgi:hypothetical protein